MRFFLMFYCNEIKGNKINSSYFSLVVAAIFDYSAMSVPYQKGKFSHLQKMKK